MKITILNGSPKGDLSVTLQYINFIHKKNPELELSVHHVSQKIKSIEKKEKSFEKIINDVRDSDAVWWSVPIYVCLIPSQYKRFIELIWEKGAEKAFRDKYTAVITTSIHFYDSTGNNYMHSICDDLNMKYVDFFSPDMYDLLVEEHRAKLLLFAENFIDAVNNKVPVSKSFNPAIHRDFDYAPGKSDTRVDTGNKKILVLTDSSEADTNLSMMIRRFMDSFSSEVELADLSNINIIGGCLGCIECGFDNRCAYTGKDDFIDFYNDKVKTADIVVYAGTIKDRYLSSTWKQFFDRRFFNTHIPTQTAKQIAYLISGPLSQIPNLKEIISALAEMDQANLSGIVTDEFGESKDINALLQNLANKLVSDAEKEYIRPITFLGVGGRKIFRDDIWGRLRFPFIADHDYYEKHGLYDFPNVDPDANKFSLDMIEAIKDPEAKEMIRKMIKTQMVEPHKKVVETK
jgi:multimeric flavodoxin WrbA